MDVTTRTVRDALPRWIKDPLRRCRDFFYGTGHGRICPICGRSSRKFRPYGLVPRKDAVCVHCHASERHRFLGVYLDKFPGALAGASGRFLHVAPEPCLAKRFREAFGGRYVTGDLFDPSADLKMDVTDIPCPDGAFDLIYCGHVLEHVADDRKAMREFHRVLGDAGCAILTVPISGAKTVEDPSVRAPEDRERAFGQWDHVRSYGLDIQDRLAQAGFSVQVVRVGDVATADEARRMGLTEASGELFVCTKPRR